MNLREFDDGILDFMDGSLDFVENSSTHFNVVHGEEYWLNPTLKSLNSIPELYMCL